MKIQRSHIHHCFALIIVLAAVCCLSAWSQTVVFTGRVIDCGTNCGVDRASVKVRETGQQTSTDSTGMFRFPDLVPGLYTLSVRHIAYASSERTVVIHADGTAQSASGRAAPPAGGHPIRSDRTTLLPDGPPIPANDNTLLPDGLPVPAEDNTLHADSAVLPADVRIIEIRRVILPSAEVIIHSTRTSSSARYTPYPVDLANGEQMLRHSPATVSDVISQLPGAFLVRDGAWETAISIRGMSRSNIVMLVDDTRIETANDIAGALSLVDMQDIDRVEVLRSPGSSLFGSGALGGVIHMVTKRPSFSDLAGTRCEFTEGATSADKGASHHLAVEHSAASYALRFSGGYRKAGDMMTPEGILPNSHYSDFTLAGTLGLAPFGTHSLFISYQRSQAEDAGIPGGAPIAASASARYLLARRECVSLDYAIPNISALVPLLTLRLSRQTIDRNVEIVQSPASTLTPHASHTTASVQVESKLAILPAMLLTLGTEAWQRDLDSRRERILNGADMIIGERPAPASSYFSAGAYAHGEWHPGARVTLAFGTRFDWIRVSNDDAYNPEYVITSGIPDRFPPNRVVLWNKNTTLDGSWSANAGAVYALTPTLNLSCLAAGAYRSPSLEERFQFIDLGSLVRVGDPGLRPEQSVSVNAGADLQIDRLASRVDVFINRLTDLVAEMPGSFEGRAALVKTNIGEARLYGFEVSGTLTLARWAAVSSSISFVRGEDTRTHSNLPQIAPLNGHTSLMLFIPAVGTMDLSAAYAAAQDLTAAGEARTPGYAASGAGFSSEPFFLRQASFTLRAGVRNMFDTAYRSHLSTLRGLIQLEPGRNLYLSVTVCV